VFCGILYVEKLLRHRQQERLAETPRPRNERHVGMSAEELAQERRLIYIVIVLLTELCKKFRSNGHHYVH